MTQDRLQALQGVVITVQGVEMCVCVGGGTSVYAQGGCKSGQQGSFGISPQRGSLHAACPRAHSAQRLPGLVCLLGSLPTQQRSQHFKDS